jgi:N-methylhydantoinase A
LSVPDTTDFVAAFHRAHERAYGHSDPHRPVEIVNVRCRATGLSPRTELPRISRVRSGSAARAERKVNCFFGGRPIAAALYGREKLQAGHEFGGPAIIVEYSATTLVPLGWRARVDPYGQILLSKADKVARHRDR